MADSFSSVYTIDNDNVQPDVQVQPDVAFLDEIKITGETVKKKLDSLNITKSTGPDKLHPHILKE